MKWNWRYQRMEPTATDRGITIVLVALIGPVFAAILVLIFAWVTSSLWGWQSIAQIWPWAVILFALLWAMAIVDALRCRRRARDRESVQRAA